FQRMLADAASGRFDTIVCWKSDRLSRGMYPAAALMEVVEAHGVGLEAVMDAIDMKTFGLMAAIGKIELDNFRERSSMGKRGAARQGRIPVNHVPDGYRIAEARTPEVDEERAEVVRRIFRHSVHDGMGAATIAQALEAEGIPTARPGSRWHAAQVNRVLRNEVYKGTWWYGKIRHTATDSGMRRHGQPRERWVRVPFPPLVDEEIWERAQVLRRRRLTRSPRNTKTFHLLQHLVRCSECGMLMGPNVVRRQSVRKGGKTYRYELDPPRRYYQCYGMRTHRLRCREHPVIRADRLEELVWSEVRRVLEQPELIAAALATLELDQDGGLAEEVARTERELAGVQREEDRAIRLYVTGKITEKQLDHQRRFISETLERLRARLDEYRERESARAGRGAALEQVVQWARSVGTGLDRLAGEERRELLDLLLEDATIDGENRVTLTLAIPTDGELVPIAEPEPTTRSIRCGRHPGAPGA
ncbi:MAG: recombinase family protein, partial [Dehalococcoidia bacterium]|nr:recombinase family protein [Dehalococcoidia bacterium]